MGAKIIKYFKQLSITRKVILILITILVIAYIFCLPRQLFHVPYSTVVTDRNGELLGARIASDGQWRFPPRTTTPEKVKQCLITFEDRHFYHHWGVNPVSTGRAAYQNLKNKRIVSGGSTLTMQTIRLARNESRTFGEKFIEMILATRLEFRASKEINRSDIRNLAILVIDIRTNQVVAYCGNVNFERKQSGNQVDVIQAPRSTGSILKPFLYYAMLQEGSLLPHTLLPDIPININGFTPQNFSLQFEGAVPASEALARSLNIPAVTMLQKYGVPKFHTFLRQIGLKTINRPASHYGLSLILGGAEATLWDVTNTYAHMGRSLLQLPQTECSLLLSDTEDSENSEAVTSAKTTDVFQPGAVWQTFNALTEVNRPEEIDWKSIPSMHPIAWKTGTSHGFRDAWAVGVTPHYAVGVWVGNATGEGKPGLVGARTAGPVLFDIFSLLPPTQWFKRPENVFVKAEVCRKSGHLKGRFCEETDTLLILPAGLKTEACPYHHLITLSADETHRIYENCANLEPTIQKSWFTLPPVWEWYYRQHHPEYSPLPPFKPGCGEDALQPMQFIYPPMNARIVLPKQMDGSPGYMTAELVHGNPVTTIFWHLDNTYLTQTQDFHKISLQPTPGKHSLTAVDSAGNTVTTTFYINPL